MAPHDEASSVAIGADGITRSFTDPNSPVTVVILCYDHARFVTQALDSVAEQRLRPCHLVVVDDASDDTSGTVIADHLSGAPGRITTLFHQANRGLTKTLNETLALVDSEYVAFLAADDWMEPERLHLQAQEFENRGTGCAAVHSDMYRVDERGARLPGTYGAGQSQPDGDMFLASIERCAIGAPSVMLRTSAVRQLGGYDESLPMEDYDLWLRLTRDYEIAYIDRPLVNYRTVTTSMSNTTPIWSFREWHLSSLAKHLDLPGERGEAVAARMQHLAKILYFDGRSPALTRRDLLAVASHQPNTETVALLAISTACIPGPAVAHAYSALHRRAAAARQRLPHLRRRFYE